MRGVTFGNGLFIGFAVGAIALGMIIRLAPEFFIAYSVGKSDGYQMGQIDAINGEIKFQLIKQKGGSTKWEKIERK